MAFKDTIQMGDGVRVQMSAKKKQTRHASFQKWKKQPHEFETSPDFRRGACIWCNLPAPHPIHTLEE